MLGKLIVFIIIGLIFLIIIVIIDRINGIIIDKKYEEQTKNLINSYLKEDKKN